MKKLFLLLLALPFAALVSTSCDKVADYGENIVGKWNVDDAIFDVTAPDAIRSYVETLVYTSGREQLLDRTFEFRADGACAFDGQELGGYTVSGGTLSFSNGSTLDIRSLKGKKMELYGDTSSIMSGELAGLLDDPQILASLQLLGIDRDQISVAATMQLTRQ